jgi:hypothetical protein
LCSQPRAAQPAQPRATRASPEPQQSIKEPPNASQISNFQTNKKTLEAGYHPEAKTFMQQIMFDEKTPDARCHPETMTFTKEKTHFPDK